MRLFLFSILLFLSSKNVAQLYGGCGADIHGVGEAHIECVEDIIITSTEHEGTEGSIIEGLIAIEAAYANEYSIRITPGYSSVRIVSEDDDILPETHRTNIGNGGNTGGLRLKNPEEQIALHNVNIYPNPAQYAITIASVNSKITQYQVVNLYGLELMNETISPMHSHQHSIQTLKKGMYIIKINLEDGSSQSQLILKE